MFPWVMKSVEPYTPLWRDLEWKAFSDSVRPYETRFARKAFRAFVACGDVAVKTLKAGSDQESILAEVRATSLRLFAKIGEQEFPLVLKFGWNRANRQIAALSRRRSLRELETRGVFDLTWPEVASYLRNRPRVYSPIVSDTTVDRFRSVLTRLFDEGKGIDEMSRGIREFFGSDARVRSVRVSRTEVIGASNAATDINFRQNDDVLSGRQWLCVTGNTRVSGYGVTHIARRWHAGPIIEIRTASGCVATVTPEHPILTRRGWVGADRIHERDDLVRYAGSIENRRPLTGRMPDVDNVPPMIAEVFDALYEPAARRGMVSRVVNFDCEGRESQVEVISIDGELSQWLTPATSERIRNVLFKLSDARLSTLFADSALSGQVRRNAHTRLPHNQIGDLSLGETGHLPYAHTSRLRARPRSDSGEAQALMNAGTGAVIPSSQFQNGRATFVLSPNRRSERIKITSPHGRGYGQHGGNAQHSNLCGVIGVAGDASLGTGPYPDAHTLQPFHDSPWSTSEPSRDRLGRDALSILFNYDRCVSVKVISGDCHVYDYSTETGWMLANSLIVHNSTRDERTRDTHREADGQERGLNEPFNVGGAQLMYPGDANGPPQEIISCRCTLAGITKGLPGFDL